MLSPLDRRNLHELQRFMPLQLSERWRDDLEVKDQLKSVFDKFYGVNTPANPDHFKAKYIEVYEKDEMCGTHIFKLKQVRAMVSSLTTVVSFHSSHPVQPTGPQRSACPARHLLQKGHFKDEEDGYKQ